MRRALILLVLLPALAQAGDPREGAIARLKSLAAKAAKLAKEGGKPVWLTLYGPRATAAGIVRARRIALLRIAGEGKAEVIEEHRIPCPLHPDHVVPVRFRYDASGKLVDGPEVVLLGTAKAGAKLREALRVRVKDGALHCEMTSVDPTARSAAALIRAQLSASASHPMASVKKLIEADGPPVFAKLDQTLTALTMFVSKPAMRARVGKDVVLDFGAGPPAPRSIADEMGREAGKFSILQMSDIVDFTCEVQADGSARGTVRTSHKGAIKWTLRAEWRAKRVGERWTISEFALPTARLAVVRGEKQWKMVDRAKE